VTQEELEKKIKRTRAETQAAIERSEALSKKFKREFPIRSVTTELAFRRLREAARGR